MNPKKPIDLVGQRIREMVHKINVVNFFLDQYIPETKGEDFFDRLNALGQKIMRLETEANSCSKALDALERIYSKK